MRQVNMRNSRQAFMAVKAAIIELEEQYAALKKEVDALKKQKLAVEPKRKIKEAK